jgi:hypothetical protein
MVPSPPDAGYVPWPIFYEAVAAGVTWLTSLTILFARTLWNTAGLKADMETVVSEVRRIGHIFDAVTVSRLLNSAPNLQAMEPPYSRKRGNGED